MIFPKFTVAFDASTTYVKDQDNIHIPIMAALPATVTCPEAGTIDLPAFLACFQGPGVEVDPICDPVDFDADSDVDLEDVGAFLRSFAGW